MKVRSIFSLITSLAILGAASCFLEGVAKAETQTAESGNVRAEVSLGRRSGLCSQNPRLRLVRKGQTVFNEDIPKKEVGYCWLLDIQVRDLDKDNEPEIILDVFSGGAHCCTSSLIYRYDARTQKYTAIAHRWGNGERYSIEDINRDGYVEFVFRDDRFAYKFASYGGSYYPLQIWQYSQGKMTNVTHRYPQAVKNHAAQLWQKYITTKPQSEVGRAILAAYLADKYSLGEGEDGWRRVQEVYKESDRSQFFTQLRKFLGETGYIR
ncbi:MULTISPECIES: hypothetical protein [unclassified Microcoleus]|uniref:hypothetical protein n=1 Tax=unclassified Microcoleus TaxID=2642155 RepID=UPI0025FEBBA0|nr:MULTISPECIES: hypothetical protein [unclassified Microcoleus]